MSIDIISDVLVPQCWCQRKLVNEVYSHWFVSRMIYLAHLSWFQNIDNNFRRIWYNEVHTHTHTDLSQNDLAYLFFIKIGECLSIRTFHLWIPQFQDASRELIKLMVPQCWHQRKLTNLSKNEVHIHWFVDSELRVSLTIILC